MLRGLLFKLYHSKVGMLTARVWLLVLFFGVWGVQSAYAGLTITPTTWNVIGLDSNNTSVGPNTFQTGARVCNTGGTGVTNVSSSFIWDSSNAFINLSGPSTLTSSSLAAGMCRDFFFSVVITRTPSAYNTARRYHITVSGDNVASVSTPTPRELYVEKIISQARNAVNTISGPTTVYVGQTYNYTVNASTATQGYAQLEAFLDLSNIIFQVQSISTIYSEPIGGTNDKFYADACGWDNNPLSGNYRSCIGPENYTGGKAGGTVVTTYTVKVLSTGNTTASTLILDFSGSSYHYNSDYGVQIISITSLPPPLTLSKSANPTILTAPGTVSYTLRLSNTGPFAMTVSDFVDTLPTSPASATYTTNSSTFNGAAIGNPTISGANLTWNGSFVVPVGQTRDLEFSVTLPAVEGTYTNQAIAHMSGFQIDTTQIITDNAPATATVMMQFPDLTIAKTHSGNFNQGQTGANYSLTVTNSGTSSTNGTVTVTDTLPAGLTATAISGTGWSCILGTLTCTRDDALAATTSYPLITLTVNVSITAPNSVINSATVSGGGETNTSNDQANDTTTIDIAASPNISLVKSVNPNGVELPGTDLSYTIIYTNSGNGPANNFVLMDPNAQNLDPIQRVFQNVDFKIGSMTSTPGTSGLVATFEYSNDGGTTWTYTPVSGAGGAPAGYDRLVTNVRWTFTGNLSQTPPNNSGTAGFIVRIR
jgi:uncharacterized repeat protein (TIGR01451 family)